MSHKVLKRSAIIFGKMPVVVEIACGVDDSPVYGREYYEEVEGIWWERKDGSKGKEVPQHLVDKLEEQDPYFCNLIEQCWVNDIIEEDGEV